MIHILRMLMLQILASMAVIVVAMLLLATFAWSHDWGPHRWLNYQYHPKSNLNCCNPEGDCIRLLDNERPRLVGDEWIVNFRNGQTYRWPVDELNLGEDEHWWLCFSLKGQGEYDRKNLDYNKPRCLIAPVAG